MRVVGAGARGMVALKGDLGDEPLGQIVGEVVGAALPEVGEVQQNGQRAVLWMAPDELLLLVEATAREETLGRLRRMAEGRHVLVEDVSDMRDGFRLEGPGCRDVLAKLTPADVSPGALPPGRVRRSHLGQVAAAFWLTDTGTAEVLCFRSVAAYVEGLLKAAARDPVGFHG